MYQIYHDSIQEGSWFQGLDARLSHAQLHDFPKAKDLPSHHQLLQKALSYDRPDIILCHNDVPVLVVERTIEVPSGHNVGQRFARLVAAAEHGIPVVYFGPYAAYKHGGVTQGPRYMNLRLFYSLDELGRVFGTAVTPINWPVDRDYEIIRDPSKDVRMRLYLDLFLNYYHRNGMQGISRHIMDSEFEAYQIRERDQFIQTEVQRPEQYNGPPNSVTFQSKRSLARLHSVLNNSAIPGAECVVYNIGMTYVRSDPYTGMSLLYSFLYCGGLTNRTRALVLHFPNISITTWNEAASNSSRKDVRLYKLAADAIIFSDDCRLRNAL